MVLVPSVIPLCDDFFLSCDRILPKVTLRGTREALYSSDIYAHLCKLILTFLPFCHYHYCLPYKKNYMQLMY